MSQRAPVREHRIKRCSPSSFLLNVYPKFWWWFYQLLFCVLMSISFRVSVESCFLIKHIFSNFTEHYFDHEVAPAAALSLPYTHLIAPVSCIHLVASVRKVPTELQWGHEDPSDMCRLTRAAQRFVYAGKNSEI